MRWVLGVAYRGSAYHGWQSQPGVDTVQDRLEAALTAFADQPVATVCAGRTDAGVHALNQVVHLDTAVHREPFSWVRGTNRFLPPDVAVQWCVACADDFHARNRALARRYRYVLRESPVRPALEAGLVGWTFRPLDATRLQSAAAVVLGQHDFSAFRSSECQAKDPVKDLRRLDVGRHGAYWIFDFEANAFLHHMVRNLMGSLLAVGAGLRDPAWLAEVLASRNRDRAAPTFAPDGLYFRGPVYDPAFGIPTHTAAHDWFPSFAASTQSS
jgi:tRNA pseudouridine38-40 synthase